MSWILNIILSPTLVLKIVLLMLKMMEVMEVFESDGRLCSFYYKYVNNKLNGSNGTGIALL